MLNALVRPYPRAVAGTPVRWGFDPDSRVFELVYRTLAPGGAALSPSAETEVFVPRRHYSRGYCATVTGAQVVSRPRDLILRLVNRPGAAQVTVRITPCSLSVDTVE
jgi:endoglycosylceramidase